MFAKPDPKPQVHSPAPSGGTEVVQVQLLKHSSPPMPRVKRNIFQFGGKTEPEQLQTPVLRIPQSQPSMASPEELPDVHYLGFYLEKQTGLMLASIVNGGRVYVGKVGQTLGGKYELLEITADHVILRLKGDERVLRVPLGKGPANVVNSTELKAHPEGN
jgi:type II secretory pathway component PulC